MLLVWRQGSTINKLIFAHFRLPARTTVIIYHKNTEAQNLVGRIVDYAKGIRLLNVILLYHN